MSALKHIRVQKRYQIGKFLRINMGKMGIGFSVGVTGLRYVRGPRGSYFTLGLPGSGIYYHKKVGDKKGFRYDSLKKLKPGHKKQQKQIKSQQAAQNEAEWKIEKPNFYAPKWEKLLYKGVVAYQEQDYQSAVDHLRGAADYEDADLAALVLSAFLLAESNSPDDKQEAIELLEEVITTEKAYPTPIFEAYLLDITVNIAITDHVEVTLPINEAMAVTLLLVELYQAENDLEQAIDLLEQVDEFVGLGNDNIHNDVLLLSLFELYFLSKHYQDIINKVTVPNALTNNATLGQLFYYARALQETNLHTAAIKIFTLCLRRKKGFDPELLQACRLWRALSFIKTNQKARARQELERLLAVAPTEEIRRATMQALHAFWPEYFASQRNNAQRQLTP